MVTLNKYYHFSANEIEYMEVSTVPGDFPYRITVHLKSGAQVSVSYKTESNRDSDRYNLVKQIECEQKRDFERLWNEIYLLKGDVKTLNHRQLRIWRQLRDLLKVKVEED